MYTFSCLEEILQVCFLCQMSSNVAPKEEEGKCTMYFNEL